jgi:hypothetical protein
MVDAPVVPISPVMAVEVPWLVMPAPPPKTAKVAATPRVGAATAVLATPRLEAMGTVHAAKSAANIRIANPPRTFFVNVFIFLYLLVQILYHIWLIVKYYLYIIYAIK